MSHKNVRNTQLSQEEFTQVQHLLDQYSQIAESLHTSTTQADAEGALAPLLSQSEEVQIAVLKALSKETNTKAADVLTAMNALCPIKEVRKEARRALLQLEASKITSQWKPPVVQAPAVQMSISQPPRFWKGFVSQTRDEGEVQLILIWEQGYEYSEIRFLSFLLDYWQAGVKDFMADITSKTQVNERIRDLRSRIHQAGSDLVECTLAEGRRLLEEALSVNTWRAKQPHEDYRAALPQINKLLLQVPESEPGEDHQATFISPELEEAEVIINFLGGWSMGDYGLAYDLLAKESPVRDNLSREEWIQLHRAWADEAKPARLELGFVHERPQPQSALWVPTNVTSRTPKTKEIEIGWSLELSDTPLSGTISELPLGTSVNKETHRHWFWTSYQMTRENGAWRIQTITDEGARVQALSVETIQKRMKEYEDGIEKSIKELRDTDPQRFVDEVSWQLTQLLHLYDALLIQLPLDEQIYEEAYSSAILTGNPERILVYLERTYQRFQSNRGDILRRLGSTLVGLAYKEGNEHLTERNQHLLQRAEESLHEAISIDENGLGHMLLAELLMSMDREEEAEQEFIKAQQLHIEGEEAAAVEAGLGNIAMRREDMQAAIPHYQRVAEIDPRYPGVWFSLGFANRLLNDLDQAEGYYQRALQLEPGDIRIYAELTAIYMNTEQAQKARTILEQGIRTNPASAHLFALLASVLFEIGDKRGAQRRLDEAERLDPTLDIVQSVRQHIYSEKKK
ncbi:tetratricopeptide repeat protein [Tengunoibacter tsumagoiensis]|uniref:Uncharacterized protein n=1 Tax=Tengunoibacter tsumagoiensis TaxID=2014871 RepID=A0A402A2K9_9CHLR|nr:tetratricopeptide repeat protein [Tengunoibacter tsumagoiensis]GCE13364.1 hypothetical protein KTT_32230 [Tengunoibacter tsumagoiensis]